MKCIALSITFLISLLTSSTSAAIVGQWDFTGGSLLDLSGNGHHGANNGAALTTDRFGNANSAYDFVRAQRDSIWTGNWAVPDLASFSLWSTTPNGFGDSGMMFNAGNNGQGPDLFFAGGVLTWNVWDSLQNPFRAGPNPGQGAALGESAYPNLRQGWHHWVVVNDQTNSRTQVYLDGNLIGVANYRQSNNTFTIGNSNQNGQWGYNGKIDDVKIYDQALTGSEVQSLFDSGSISAVPEPGSILIWSLLGVAALIGYRRRNKKS